MRRTIITHVSHSAVRDRKVLDFLAAQLLLVKRQMAFESG